jgi:putative phosphotransacetylase
MNQSTHQQAINSMRVPVALSPSLAHLTSGLIQQFFCDHERLHEASRVGLTKFAALESVSLIGPNVQTIDVPVIGPARKTDEVQLSQSAALKLGIDAPLGTPGILIKGPRTQVTLELGVIRALPHIHMNP